MRHPFEGRAARHERARARIGGHHVRILRIPHPPHGAAARRPPPPGLLAFYWHFVRQTRGLYAAMFVTGLAVALIDTLIPVFIGKLVTLMQAADRAAAFARGAADARRHGG